MPTIAETVPGFESVQWWGMFAPPALSAELTARLGGEISRILVDADLKARFAAEGAEPAQGSPRDFAAFLRADYEKWGKVVKAAGIRPE